MGRKPIFYAGQCHRRVVSAEHFVRCTFPFRVQKERERILRTAIRALRPSIRRVVEMQQLQEHSMKETARMMGITIAAAKARLFHARAVVRKNSGLKANRKKNAQF